MYVLCQKKDKIHGYSFISGFYQ